MFQSIRIPRSFAWTLLLACLAAQTMFAQGTPTNQLLVVRAQADQATETLLIEGSSFITRNDPVATVTLSGQPLAVFEVSAVHIKATLPSTVPPGTYLLHVSRGRVAVQNDAFYVTIGTNGTPGPQGEKGDKGDTGAIGPEGPAGPAGPAGATGATGSQGPVGPAGPQGAAGDPGAAGATGATGATGPQGPIGPAGPQGPAGATAEQIAAIEARLTALESAISIEEIPGGWSCAAGVACQDVYDFTFAANSTVTIDVTGVTGASVLRLAAFAPGAALSDANLLTATNKDRMCGAQNAGDSITFRTTAAGVYRIAVGRDWNSSAGATGTYTVTVTSNRSFNAGGQTANDVASGAAGTVCGYAFTASAGWNCAAGVSCQDVFDFETFVPTAVTVTVTNVTGASVLRLSVVDGSNLSGVNRLNGLTSDRMCVAQNTSDTVTSPPLSPGLHRFAIGRDWNASAGGSGTYTVTFSSSVPLIEKGQTANDINESHVTRSCP